jgi:transcription initiation factor IIF auxiliary subunit
MRQAGSRTVYGNLDVTVKDSLLPPGGGGAPAWKNPESARPLYRVHLYVEGPDLPYVRSVTYTLHPTFSDRVRTVTRSASNPNCLLTIWTWGVFEVGVRIEDKKGTTYDLTHAMRYGEEVSNTPQSRFRLAS